MAWMRQENCTLKILCHQEGGINGRISAKIISASFPHVLLNSDTLSYKIIPAAGRLQGPSLCSWQKTTITVHGQCPAQHVPRPRTPTREASLQHFSCFLKLFLSTRCKALPDSLRDRRIFWQLQRSEALLRGHVPILPSCYSSVLPPFDWNSCFHNLLWL